MHALMHIMQYCLERRLHNSREGNSEITCRFVGTEVAAVNSLRCNTTACVL